MEVIVDWYEDKGVWEVISVLVTDIETDEQVQVADLLGLGFLNVLDEILDSFDWNEIYRQTKLGYDTEN
jgi:hypothetical protein